MANAACSPSHFVPGRYAAIDIGTVTCRLLVADVDAQGSLTELARAMDICNLGEGVDKTHRLSDAACERVCTAVAGFLAQIRALGEGDPGHPIPLRVVATSASRDARNASDFAERLARLGAPLSVISGQREAELSFAGASLAFPGQAVTVADIGGGSTEIIAGQAGCKPKFAQSFDVGCRRLTERYLQSDPPSAQQLADARRCIRQTLGSYMEKLVQAGCLSGPLVAVAGTATSCISMEQGMVEYDPARVHGAVMTKDQLDRLLDRLASLTLAQREQVVGLEPRRAPVIVAGLLILQTLMELGGIPSFTASEYDILQGIVIAQASPSA